MLENIKKAINYQVWGIFLTSLSIVITDYFLKLCYIKTIGGINENFIFGLFQYPELLLYFVVLIIFGIIFFYSNDRLKIIPALIMVGLGTLSNLVDRLAFGGVIDYINLTIPLTNVTLTFNLSDVLIIMGVIWYASSIFRNK